MTPSAINSLANFGNLSHCVDPDADAVLVDLVCHLCSHRDNLEVEVRAICLDLLLRLLDRTPEQLRPLRLGCVSGLAHVGNGTAKMPANSSASWSISAKMNFLFTAPLLVTIDLVDVYVPSFQFFSFVICNEIIFIAKQEKIMKNMKS